METAKKLRWDPKFIHASGWITSLIPIYIKKLFNDDMSFKDSKVIYSVQPTQGSADIDPQIFEKLKAEGIPQKDLKKYTTLKNDINLLHKLAIDFSDAVIVNDPDIDPDLSNYIIETGKPVLMAQDMAHEADKYLEFYNSL